MAIGQGDCLRGYYWMALAPCLDSRYSMPAQVSSLILFIFDPRFPSISGYICALVLACGAIALTLNGIYFRASEALDLTQALQVSLLRVLDEQPISYQLRVTQDKVLFYNERSQADEAKAISSEQQSEVVAHKAEKQHEKADGLWKKVYRTDSERLDLLRQLHIEEEIEHSSRGLSDLQGVRQAFSALGQLTGLEADQTNMQIQQDLLEVSRLQSVEDLEIYAATVFEEQANKTDTVVQTLHQTAKKWKEQALRDNEKAQQWNVTANYLKAELNFMEDATIPNLLRRARKAEYLALLCFWCAIPIAAYVFLYFMSRSVPKLSYTLAQVLSSSPSTRSSHESMERFAVTALHLLVFVAAAAWCQPSQIEQLKDPVLRAIVILYFCAAGSVVQTVSLHLIPKLLVTKRILSNAKELIRYGFLRAVLLFPLFVMEFFAVWLGPFRHRIFNNLPGIWIHLSLIAGLGLYYYYTRWRGVDEVRDDESTILTLLEADGQLREHSLLDDEATPLTRVDPERCTRTPALSRASVYRIDAAKELNRLALLWEMFVIFCMTVVVDVSLEFLFGIWPGFFLMACFCLAAGFCTHKIIAKSLPRRLLFSSVPSKNAIIV